MINKVKILYTIVDQSDITINKKNLIFFTNLSEGDHVKFSSSHCLQTAAIVNAVQPHYFSFLTTVAIETTPYRKMVDSDRIQPLTCKQLLQEMRLIISAIDPNLSQRIIFRATHVSNPFMLGGILPRERKSLINTLDQWIETCPEGVYPPDRHAAL